MGQTAGVRLPRASALVATALLGTTLLVTSGCGGGSAACQRWDYRPDSSTGATSARAALDAYLTTAPGNPPKAGWRERGADAARSFSSGRDWRIGVEQAPDRTWYVANASSC